MQDRILASDATLMELADVLGRAKFDPYVTIGERQEFLRLFDRLAERIAVVRVIRACRDPKDDKFLELAVVERLRLLSSAMPICWRLTHFKEF